jgi:hypothetical protein
MKIILLIAFILLVLFFVMRKPVANPMDNASGTGPGYIPAFQGHPEIGVRSA